MGKINLLTIVGAILFSFVLYKGTYYYSEMTLGLSILSAFLSWRIGRTYHWSVGIIFFYCALHAVVLNFYQPQIYGHYGASNADFIGSVAGSGLMILTLTVGTLAFAELSHIRVLMNSIPFLVAISSFLTIARSFSPQFLANQHLLPTGIVGNPSIDPTFIGIAYPVAGVFLLKKKGSMAAQIFCLALIFFAPISIFLSKGSNGIASLVVSASCLFFCLQEGLKRKLLFSGLTTAILSGSAFIFLGEKLLNDSTRFWAYGWAWDWWKYNASWKFGTGLSTFWVLGPYAQSIAGSNQGYFPFLHSDWLQIGFELGAIGLFLSFLAGFFLVKNCIAKKRYHVLSSVLSFATVMVFNFPLRWFLTAFLGALILRLGFMEEKEYDALLVT